MYNQTTQLLTAGKIVKPNDINAFCVNPGTTQVKRLNFSKYLIWLQVDSIEPFFAYCDISGFAMSLPKKSYADGPNHVDVPLAFGLLKRGRWVLQKCPPKRLKL